MNDKTFNITQRKRKQIQKLKSYSSITGVTFSQKNKEIIQFESSLEADVAKLLEFNSLVISYVDHPFSIEFNYKGKTHRYTPDFYVELYSDLLTNPEILGKSSDFKKWLIEVKYSDSIEKFNEFDKFKYDQVREICEKQGIFFTIVDESIRGHYLNNAKRLLKVRNERISDNWSEVIQPFLKAQPNKSSTIEALLKDREDSMKGSLLRSIWVLLANDFISCDLNKAIKYDTIIKLEYEG